MRIDMDKVYEIARESHLDLVGDSLPPAKWIQLAEWQCELLNSFQPRYYIAIEELARLQRERFRSVWV